METDPKFLLIPKLLLRANATLPELDLNLPASYSINFGILEKAVLKIEGDLKESFGASGGGAGGLGLEDIRRVKNKATIEVDVKKMSQAVWARIMGSASGSAPRPGKVFNLFGWAGLASEDEGIKLETGEAILKWYGWRGGFYFDGDYNANGDDYGMLKLRIAIYLGTHPGTWDGASARPLVYAPDPEPEP